MNVWYNEWDKFKAQWLRELGAGGEIPQGTVDERSILDIRGADLAGYGACHFFAGIGGWPLALRLAGCGDDWKGWTASLPCQPFSSAGKRKGFADERHLWPPFFKLVDERRPGKILGEQVDSKDGRAWLARVQADLESIGYAVGRASLNSAGAGAPNIRQRLYWVAHASGSGLPGHDGGGGRSAASERTSALSGWPTATVADVRGTRNRISGRSTESQHHDGETLNDAIRLVHPDSPRLERTGRKKARRNQPAPTSRPLSGWATPVSSDYDKGSGGGERSKASLVSQARRTGGLADPNRGGSREGRGDDGEVRRVPQEERAAEYGTALSRGSCPDGFWADCFAIPLEDGTSRRVGRGIWPVAPRVSSRLGPPKSEVRRMAKDARANRAGRIIGYGDAINPVIAAIFIRAAEEAAQDLAVKEPS